MIDDTSLSRLVQNVTPGDALRRGAKERMLASIQPRSLQNTIQSVTPSPTLAVRMKERVLRSIGADAANELRTVSALANPSAAAFARMKERILSSLEPVEDAPLFASGLKWASAFAVLVLLIRSLPIILLPSTSAEAGVQLLPVDGTVSVYVGGVWRDVVSPEMLTSAVMIRTGEASHATLLVNDDGVFRFGPNTLFKLHDTTDRPSALVSGPTATLVHGELWTLGLLPPVTDGISIDVSSGVVSVNMGSVAISDDGTESTVTVYNRGATVQHDKQTVFAVTGERVRVRPANSLQIASVSTRQFADPWVSKNLEQDAVHRGEIAKLQEERREKLTGILPTSFLYPAKRLAEQVDVLFTLTQDGRTEKRFAQANTRLNEALALMKAGQSDQAAAPLTEYKDALISMAADTHDNLVKHLLKKQIADASVSIGTSGGPTNVELLKSALADVGTVIPNANLDAKDIEGYVLINRIAHINDQLSKGKDIPSAVAAYKEIRPYLKPLLSANAGMQPQLQKEAVALLVTTSSLIREAEKTRSDAILTAFASDIAPYLPAETESILVSEARLNARVKQMYDRIFIFRAPLSRYNQLQVEMGNLRGDPDHGTLLRRLKAALPEFLGEYVNTEIQLLGDEFKAGEKKGLTNNENTDGTDALKL